MDQLPDSLLLQILSQLNDSADVARCRVTSKAFNTVFPDLRSINLRYSLKWYYNWDYWEYPSPGYIKPNSKVFLDLISKLRIVESVSIGVDPVVQMPHGVDPESSDLYLTDGDLAMEWLPRVSESLKSLSICDLRFPNPLQSNILPLISAYCHSLVTLKLKSVWLFVGNLIPMPMLTSFTLSLAQLEDENLNELNKCFPNLQVLNLYGLTGLKDPKIHLVNLKTCCFDMLDDFSSLTLITPTLITLKIGCSELTTLHVEAPMVSQFELCLRTIIHAGSLTVKKFDNLKTLSIKSGYIGSYLSRFSITKTVANLALGTVFDEPQDDISKLTLVKVFTVFPNVSSLCINHSAWSDLETCLNIEDWETLDGRIGLKTFRAYLKLVDPSLTFSSVARLLDQCVGLSEVSLLIYGVASCPVPDSFKSFMSKCMARWPELKWRWGIWNEEEYDSWITDGLSN